MKKYEQILTNIGKTEDLINFLPMLSTACTVSNAQVTDRSIDDFELLIQRYSLRMLYHAKNFITKVLQFIKDKENKVPRNDTIGFQIGPEVYFEFDAFLYSCKSILEGNMKDKGKLYFSKNRKSRFTQFALTAYQEFVSDFLTPLRNEAVHLNYLGTSISQMIFITDCDGEKKIKLHSTFKTSSGQELNLIEIFTSLFQLSNDVLNKIILLVIEETIDKLGMPKDLDTKYHVGHSVFKIRDFIK